MFWITDIPYFKKEKCPFVNCVDVQHLQDLKNLTGR